MKRGKRSTTRSVTASPAMTRCLAVLGFACFALVPASSSAQAKHAPCLSQPALTMLPGLDAVPGSYEVAKGRVRLKGDQSSLVLRAPVFNTTGVRNVAWTHFSVLYTDPDGREEIAQVQAVLKFIDQSGSPPQELVKLDSNKARADDDESAKETRHMRVEIPEDKLNFERNYYFVEITLTGKIGQNPSPDVLGFRLCKQFK